jgi:hypothetical protein
MGVRHAAPRRFLIVSLDKLLQRRDVTSSVAVSWVASRHRTLWESRGRRAGIATRAPANPTQMLCDGRTGFRKQCDYGR